MQILFISQFFPAPNAIGNTGGTISNLNMLRVLAQRYAVTVLSFDPSTHEDMFAGESFRVFSHPAPAWRAPDLFRHWLDFVRTKTRSRIENTTPPEAVIATTSTLAAFDVCPPDTARVALVRAYENFGLRCPWVPARQRINLGKLAAVRRFQDPRLMRSADAVLTNSSFMRTAISDRFGLEPGRIHVLLQACDVNAGVSAAPPRTIGFVTRGPEKGLVFVLDLARRSPDLRYLIYGHDRDRPDFVPENVYWQGWASDRDAMFASARLWLVPSRWAEPFGRVSIEAQAADRAVLVAGTGGLPETVLDPQFRVDGFDAKQWLIRLRSLLQLAPVELQRNGARIRESFSSEAHDARVLGAMERILTGKRAKADA
ncbi:glycosyltransferase family 4 protein [Ancylobacter polymorphus]|uniref:Glycosyltransferase family 4 protein n=1 Tax=Ancylobacter polymorphus TaxID=223390 RepID=A0A9E7CXV2_9HYPH|nr:glycosyltransferase family 4 protein [Ancylobacter polymorphus]UOK72804.1 glycosyltransferase family 4 protein [Ancylobacter polymorphus]